MILPFLAAAVALPAPLPQQSTVASPPGVENSTVWLSTQKTISWTPQLDADVGPADFSFGHVADANGDVENDSVWLAHRRILLNSSITSFKTFTNTDPLAPDVSSLAYWGTPAGLGAQFISSDAIGLNLVSFETHNPKLPITSTSLAGTSVMRNSVQMRRVMLNGEWHIAGVTASGSDIKTMKEVGGSWTTGPSWTINRDIDDFTFLDFDADGSEDLVIGTPLLFGVLAQDGSVLDFETTTTSCSVARVENDLGSGVIDERLARLTKDASGDWYLTHYNSVSADTPLLVEAPAYDGGPAQGIEPKALVPFDLDRDGFEDLVILDSLARRLIVLLNQGGPGLVAGQAFTTNDMLLLAVDEIDTDQSNALNTCRPWLGDYDNDGNPDVVFGSATSGLIYLFDDLGLLPLNAASLKDGVGTLNPGASGYVSDETVYHRPVGGDREFQLAFENLPEVALTYYDAMQVRLYELEEINGELNFDPIENFIFNWASTTINKQFCRMESSELFPYEMGNDLPWTIKLPSTEPRVVVVWFRAVNTDGARVTEGSYPFIGAFAMQWDDDGVTIPDLPYFDIIGQRAAESGFIVVQGDLTLPPLPNPGGDTHMVGAYFGQFSPPPPTGPVGPTLPKNLEFTAAELW